MAKKIVRGNLNTKQIIEAEKTVKITEQAVVNTSSETKEAPGTNPLGSSGTGTKPTGGVPPQLNQGVANPQIAGPTPGQIKGPEVGKPEGQTGITDKDRQNLPNVAERKAEDIENPNQDVRKLKDQPNQPGAPSGSSENGDGSNNGVTAPVVNKNATGTTGLNSDNKVQNAAAQKVQDANKTAQDIKNAKDKLGGMKLAGGAGCWWTILGILIIILVIVIVNFGGIAYNATLGEFGKSSPLPSGKNYENAKKVLQTTKTQLKTAEGTVNKYKQIDMNAEDQNAIKNGEIDKRLNDLLNYLSTLHPHLKISHIVSGYKKSDTAESGADRSAQITANVSAHVDGLAADISEIDYVYRVNEPRQYCEDVAIAAACGPFAPACEAGIRALKLGDLVYYASDEVPKPTDSSKTASAVTSGQDPAAAAAIAATTTAQTETTALTQKIDQSKAKIDQIKTSINKTKDNLIAKKNQLTGLLAGAQGTARQTIQDQITLLNANIDQVDAIVAKLGEYQGKIGDFSGITSSLQTNLGGINQTINKYTTYAIPQIKVDTGINTVDARIQGLIAQSTNKITDASPLQGISGIVNGQIAGISQKIGEASGAMTQFSNSLDPILTQINAATSQIDSKINLASSASSAIISQADLKPIGDINTSVTSVGTNPILSQTGASNVFGQLDTTASGMTGLIKNNVNTAISSGINVADAPVDQINGLANGKIDTINEKMNTLVGGLNGIRNNFVGQAGGVAGQPLQESEILKKINGTISKAQSILQTITTLRNNLGSFVSKVTALQSSLSTIGNAANTVADMNKFSSKVGVDTSAAGNIAKQIDKINKAITASLTKVNGILTMLDEETANLTRLLADMQKYTSAPEADVSKYIDTLTPSLDRLDAIGHIDILSALNIDLSPLSSLTGIINGYIDKIKKEAFETIQAELQTQLTKVMGENIAKVIGTNIPGVSALGLGGGVDNTELMRQYCEGNKGKVTPSDVTLGGNDAVIIPIKVSWQDPKDVNYKGDENDTRSTIDSFAFDTVFRQQAREKVHELLAEILKFPYKMNNKYYYKVNQIITYSEDRDVKPFWPELKELYGLPRAPNVGLFAMPESWPHVHVAY